jgi:pyruvate/2-oxoglutarate dehydrogenase complex dihydrolipoamide acyltransferase (E2) component
VSPENAGSNDQTSGDWGVEQIFEPEYNQDLQPELNPDLDLDVPVLQIDELDLEVEDLQLQVSLQTQLAGFVNISTGVNAHIGKAKLAIKGVEAQARLKVRLEGTLETLRRALETIDRNPQVLGGAPYGGEQVGEDLRAGQSADNPPNAEGGVWGQNTTERAEDPGAEVGAAEVGATEAARRRAEKLGVELSRIEGTGAGGRVLVRDVQKAAG